jgi:type IV pilus assembly protein PilZ
MSDVDGERRESGRAAVEVPIEYERLNALLSDYTHNISRGGTFIRTDRPLPVGTMLDFTIMAPQLGDPIVLRGVVRWLVEPEEAAAERPSGMGIAFVFDSPRHKAAVQGRLDRLMVASLGPTVFQQLMGRPAPLLETDE